MMHRFKKNTSAPRCQCLNKNSTCGGGSLQTRQIFQVYPPRNDVTFADIQDAIDASAFLNPLDKRAYFESQGIDYDRVQQYHPIVSKLETLWTSSTHNHTHHQITAFDPLRAFETFRAAIVLAVHMLLS